MARIPDHEVARLNAEIDLPAFIGQWVELKKAGVEWKGLSPFTTEKSPSFFVNPAKAKWFDFSSGKNGNAIDFVMNTQNRSFRDAVRVVSDFVGQDLRAYLDNELTEDERRSADRRRVVLSGVRAAHGVFIRAFIDPEGGKPYRILSRQRGLTIDLIKAYGICAAPERYELPAEAKGEDVGLLATVEGQRSYLRFRNRLMFPVRTLNGDIVTFGGRALGDAKPKYLNGPETPLFKKSTVLYGLYEAKKRAGGGRLPELLLVEGYMDVVSLAGVGLDAAASMGTAISERQLQLAAQHAEVVYFCTDGDAAGQRGERKALERVLPLLGSLKADIRLARMPAGMDPDDLVRQPQGGAAMRQVMDRAVTAVEAAVAEVVGPDWRTLKPEARVRHFNENLPLVGCIGDDLMRESAIQLLSERSGFPEVAIRDKLASMVVTKPTPAKVVDVSKEAPPKSTDKPASSALQSLLGAIGHVPADDEFMDSSAPTTPQSAVGGVLGGAIQGVYLSGQSVGAAGAQITRADVLRRSPPLRAAQILLSYDLTLSPWQKQMLSADQLALLRGGEILRAVAIEVLTESAVDLQRAATRLPDEGQRALLYYLIQDRPQLPAETAAAVLDGLLTHCTALVRDAQLAELMSISEERDLTAQELEKLQILLPAASAKSPVKTNGSQYSPSY